MDGPVASAGDPDATIDEKQPGVPFDDAVKEGLHAELSDLPEIEFVQDRDAVVTGTPPGHVIEDGVLLTLGPIGDGAARVEVGNELWINGLAGQWQTYVVELRDESWTVTGTTGPVSIS
ncbi:MAG: hypothetical protein LC722_01135 [Actinobacteria bacterium]|nr:hypothetical protein [Actinomycetota bacterium]